MVALPDESTEHVIAVTDKDRQTTSISQSINQSEALALPVRKFGTVCHDIVACGHLTSATNILKHY